MNKEEKERILACVVEQIEKERTPRKTRHLRRTAAIALAAVMLLACGAFTVKVLKLDSRLASLLGGTSDQITQSVTDINAAVEKKWSAHRGQTSGGRRAPGLCFAGGDFLDRS